MTALGTRQIWLVVIAVDLAMFLAALDTTVVGTAMPTVVASLGGLSLFSWIFSIYLLTATVALPIFGRLSDLFGRRTMFLAAVWIFTGASALCGLATSMVALIAARALQGIGAGGIFGLSQAVFGELFPPHRRGKMQGYLASVWGVAALVGPLIGGLLVQYAGWRWTFFVNVPVGAAASYMLMVGLRGLAGAGTRRRIDYAGAGCLTGAVVALMLALLAWGKGGAGLRTGAAAGLLVAVTCTAAFLWVESRAPEPIVPLGLFRSRIFVSTTGCLFLSGVAMFGVISYLPLFVQGVLRGSAVQAGTVLTPMTLSWVLGSALGGRVVNRLGYRRLAVAAMTGLAAGYVLLLRLTPDSPIRDAAWIGIVLGLGMGTITVTTIVAVQSAAPPGQIGVVSTLPFFFRNIGASLGVAVMGALLNAYVAGVPLNPHALPGTAGTLEALPPLARGQLAAGIRAAFLFGLAAVVAGWPLSALVPNASPAAGGRLEARRPAGTAEPSP